MPGKAARYERVNTTQPTEQGNSLNVQAAHNLETCLHLGFDPDELYHRAEVASGADSHRPGLLALQGWVENREVAAVVICEIDRLGRDPLEVLTFIRLCEENSVELHLSGGGTAENGNPISTRYGKHRETLEVLAGWLGRRT